MSVHAIALPEAAGGGGGSLLDQAVALEACAHELVPGGLLGATVEEIAPRPEGDRRTALAATGYLTPHWPQPNGLGADPTLQDVIDQELARAAVERPDLVIAGWAVPTILAHGSDEQLERFVRPSLIGELVWCQLFSEPGSGSDLASLRTRAVKVDGGWSLSGQKVWTSVAEPGDGWKLARTTLRALGGHGPGAESSDPVAADLWEALNTRCLAIAGGTTQILRNVVGERILGLPRG